MVCGMALITNNPAFSTFPLPGTELVFVDGTAYDVLVAARDKVHLGRRLLNHPLYGNLRPGHQPFRSLLLAAPAGKEAGIDADSLRLMEQALGVYEACRGYWAVPQSVSPSLFRDCSLLDRELMKATLSACCGACC